MGYEEQLQESPWTGEVPPQRSAGPTEPPTENRGGGWLASHLVLVALTIILLGAAAGLLGAIVLPKTYGACAEILYSISPDSQDDPLKQDRALSTQLVYLKSRAVLGPVAQKQGRQFDDLSKDVSVQVLNNSEVIQVEAHGATQLMAMQTIQDITKGYLTLISQPTGVSRNLHSQLTNVHTNTTQLQTRVQQLTTAVVAGTATQTSLNDAQTQLTASLDQEKTIQTRIDELNLTGQEGPDAQILTPPYPLPDPVFPQPLITTGAGALIGLIVAGAVLAVGAQRWTRSGPASA